MGNQLYATDSKRAVRITVLLEKNVSLAASLCIGDTVLEIPEGGLKIVKKQNHNSISELLECLSTDHSGSFSYAGYNKCSKRTDRNKHQNTGQRNGKTVSAP